MAKAAVRRKPDKVRNISEAKQRRIDAQRKRELANLSRKPEERPAAVAAAERTKRMGGGAGVQRDDLGFILRRGPDGMMYREDPGETARNWWRGIQARDAEQERQQLLAKMAALPKAKKKTRSGNGKTSGSGSGDRRVPPASHAGRAAEGKPGRAGAAVRPAGSADRPVRGSSGRGRDPAGRPVRGQGRPAPALPAEARGD